MAWAVWKGVLAFFHAVATWLAAWRHPDALHVKLRVAVVLQHIEDENWAELVPVQFQRTQSGLLLQMTPTNSLVDFRVAPLWLLGLGAGWQVPNYADRSRLMLGKGRLPGRHPEIQSNRVFLLGHSLGAVVAPVLAAADASIAGCVVMARPAEPIYRCVIRQLRCIASLAGPQPKLLPEQIAKAEKQADAADNVSLSMSAPAKASVRDRPGLLAGLSPVRPHRAARSLERPVLVLQGARDYQFTVQDDYHQ
ncbi:uncharacterized protein N7459_002593 [Penicillium hispanicum]|uniref:uncharacterized protein n=1 Tax=Penicillium hispanicum TaxID=1080232 RepID=UPI0025418931|nr:uncharacterized protein N7459_002593 [Penicillium hispanicum]KAJ5586828.1 hypothetical protein N7459_002593 [Penicillium hispanicum]